jgi:hypothetical protein
MSKIKVYPVRITYNVVAANKVQAAAITGRLLSDEIALNGDWYVDDQKEIDMPEEKAGENKEKEDD